MPTLATLALVSHPLGCGYHDHDLCRAWYFFNVRMVADRASFGPCPIQHLEHLNLSAPNLAAASTTPLSQVCTVLL